MKNYLLILLAGIALLASSCSLTAALRKTPEQRAAARVAGLLAEHPGLTRPDTVRVLVPYAVPEIRFVQHLVQVHDTVYLQREASALDSLLDRLQTRLDSAQRVATRAKLHELLVSRPVLTDTLCFDTLGVAGKIWRVGRQYRLLIIRNRLAGTASAAVAVQRLVPCASPGAQPWHLLQPESWALPWWAWLLIGLLLGALAAALVFRLFVSLLTHRANA